MSEDRGGMLLGGGSGAASVARCLVLINLPRGGGLSMGGLM